MNAAKVVDSAASGPVIVFGSLPPEGRDLDLLVPDSLLGPLENALRASGFEDRGRQWVRFAECTAEAIDLVPASDWELPDAQGEALFDDARPVQGFENLVRPAPHHALLIVARRVQAAGGVEPKLHERLDALVAEDPQAWDRAGTERVAWAVDVGLDMLKRRAGVAPRLARLGSTRRTAKALLAPRVIALSGLDGSGKSTQAEALKRALEKVGIDAVVVWTRLPYNPSLEVIARPLKRLLRPFSRGESPAGSDRGAYRPKTEDPVRALRRRSAPLTYLWSMVVALANGLSHRRTTFRLARGGKVVIRDRYALDSAVSLRYRYGEKSFRLQTWLIRVLSPRPLVALWFDVPAATAIERKPDKFDVEQLARQETLYAQERARMKVERVDGKLPQEELCTRLAKSAWRALR